MTTAVANGYSIARSKDARLAWERRHADRIGAQSVEEYTSTLGRLANLFPGQVRVN